MSGLLWIQDSPFATWIRESSWAIFAALIVHTISMGALVGTAIVTNLRRLGVAPKLPTALWTTLVPIMGRALAAATVSGTLLLIAYPAKALLNPVFYAKFLIIGSALLLTRKASAWQSVGGTQLDSPQIGRHRLMAVAAVVLWCAAVLAGKLLEYTHRVLLLY
jgi:hypothetical protein